MKAIFIVYNQALTEQVEQVVRRAGVRGFTRWQNVHGAGSKGGEPHLGTHTWPAVNTAMLVFGSEELCEVLKSRLRMLDEERPRQGLRVFSWSVDSF